MDRLDAMSILREAVDAGSLSAAGRRLGMPLATVSRKVSDLERHLGTRLLNRSTRQLTLTDAGRSFVAACRRILDDVAEAERSASGEYSAPKGELSLSAPIVFGRLHVLPVASAFLKTHPEIDIRLMLSDRIVDLQEDRVDIAIRIGELPDSSMVATRVGSTRRVLCGSPAYFAEHGMPQHPRELATRDCITFSGLMSADSWTFKAGKSDSVVKIHSRLVVNTAEAAIDAAIAGVGVTRVLSYQVAKAVRAGTLVVALQEFEAAPSPVSLVHTGQPLLPLKLRAFLDFAAPLLKTALSRGVL
ncbi:LysR substrate-binding domain-containing protein [Reyranella sp.]|uniref:LysR substrate-binding domain-containing protein n=1 Tax=Reyranella sp. TaxID=1929291 RepID=UPI004036A99A